MVKKTLSVIVTVSLVVAVVLEVAGSFVSTWSLTQMTVNGTLPIVDDDAVVDVGSSLWTTRRCLKHVECTVITKRIKYVSRHCTVHSDNSRTCTERTEFKRKNRTLCWEHHNCNTTFVQDYEKVPSLLLVSKSFVTPGIVSGVITIILYVIKIVLQLRSPTKRLHLKAAYLTFAAVAGAAVEVGVIIFCAMLNKEVYKLGWGPALPGAGGFLQLCLAFGGYLGWRNVGDDDFDDLSISEKLDLEHERKQFVPYGRSVSANSNTSCNAVSTKV